MCSNLKENSGAKGLTNKEKESKNKKIENKKTRLREMIAKSLILDTAAVCTAWSLLNSPRNTQCYISFKKIYSVVSTFITFVSVHPYEMESKRVVVRGYCFPLPQRLSNY